MTNSEKTIDHTGSVIAVSAFGRGLSSDESRRQNGTVMDTCPRCQSTERVERASTIVATGIQPLSRLLWCPHVPSMPTRIKVYRVCNVVGVFMFLGAAASTSTPPATQEDADAAWFGSLVLPFAVLLITAGLTLLLVSGQARREWQAAKQCDQVVRQLWPLLDYCHRCNTIFLPGGSFATDPVHTSRFLRDAADYMLAAHRGR
ncbi:hypothetical protein [Actinomadura violacea]|uniref:Uncharacterized protein n=1 Tax=Actinomadura violacea TaxID=2819934 RepID=A0ABS3S562_9ACTN|nr:hypothetical protein [Actinomadura violacea]MBO2463878.1 hypothetical protein [Actinomadura violacea]